MAKKDFSLIGRAMQPPPPPMVAVDRFNQMIEKGHLVLYHNLEDLVLEVVDVTPVLNPAIPGGRMLNVTLRGQFPVQVVPTQPNRFLAICGVTAAKRAEMEQRNGQPADPPAVDAAAASGLVLTDPPEVPQDTAPTPAKEDGQCLACSSWGPVGDVCDKCGDSKYQMVF